MNIVFLTGGISSSYATDYAATLASTLRAEGNAVKVFIRKKDKLSGAYSNLDTAYLGRGGVFDVLSPVRLSGVMRELSGPTIIHVFTIKDARLALNATALSGRQTEIKTILTFLDSENLPRFNDLENKIINTVAAVTVDTPKGLYSIESAKYVAPGMPDMRIEKSSRTDESIRLLYIGQLNQGCKLPELLKNLEDFKEFDWTLDICGTGRGSFIMGPIRRTRSAGIDTRITWHGDDFDPMQCLANADIIIGEDTPRNRLMADCAGTAFMTVESAKEMSRLFDRKEIETAASSGRKKYDSEENYNRFYNDIKALYHES